MRSRPCLKFFGSRGVFVSLFFSGVSMVVTTLLLIIRDPGNCTQQIIARKHERENRIPEYKETHSRAEKCVTYCYVAH